MSDHNIPRQTIKSEWEMEGREEKMMLEKNGEFPLKRKAHYQSRKT